VTRTGTERSRHMLNRLVTEELSRSELHCEQWDVALQEYNAVAGVREPEQPPHVPYVRSVGPNSGSDV
jgi:hypothetical protein